MIGFHETTNSDLDNGKVASRAPLRGGDRIHWPSMEERPARRRSDSSTQGAGYGAGDTDSY